MHIPLFPFAIRATVLLAFVLLALRTFILLSSWALVVICVCFLSQL